ncbi:MAG: DUF488 domain-containing protein [Gammaproteobacteria bacterium]|nr:DUF488 domain-containing protein [Gammaproteobacteria bacterium]
MSTIYTIGHGNRGVGEFLELLAAARIELLVDIRAFPGSRRHPQFRREALRASTEDHSVGYRWMGDELGGRRAPRDNSPHIALAVGVRGFADHMQSARFQTATDELLLLAQQASKVAVMCAEKMPEHCHRWLLADYLTMGGNPDTHLLDRDLTREHSISMNARITESGLTYDRQATRELSL